MTGLRALAGITFAAAAALAAGAATAQVPYRIGDDQGNVTVDMGVIESLGPMPTVPEMLRPGTPVGELGYDPRIRSLAATEPPRGGQPHPARPGVPSLGIDSAPAPDWLRRPDALRYAPLPETLGRPAAPRTGAPTLTPPSAASRSAAPRSAAPTLRPPEAPAARATEPSAPPPRSEPKALAARPTPPPTAAAPTAPPPPKPAGPSATAEAAPRTPPAPAVQAPEPPKAPPPPALPAASAPSPAKTAPAKPESETQVAAATAGPSTAVPAASPSAQGAGGDVVQVPFDPNQSALPASASASASLDALVARLRKDETLRVQLLAYADGDDDNANKARRLSLSRALAVRAYLIDKQIQSTRMDVRALGNRAKESPKDRVDVVLVSR